MRRYLFVFGISVFIMSKSLAQAEVVDESVSTERAEKESLLDKFCSMLKGEYNSSAQSTKDTTYFNIRLIMFPIWEKETDAKYFYVEQAMVGKEDKPYRQRVYKVYQTSPTTIVSAIYTIKSQEEFIQLQESPKKQKALKKEAMDYKDGCDVFLEYSDAVFKGGTNGKKCLSNIRGARYVTTEVELYEDKLISWDRGFYDSGVQAWGATAGGYIFDKIR